MRKINAITAALAFCAAQANAEALTTEAKSGETKLVLLGVAGGPTWYGDDSPHGISSAVIVNGKAYLVDFGSGAYRQSRKYGIKPGDEAALFITHLHSDHLIDLPSLLMYDPSARRRASAKLNILGPIARSELPKVTGGVAEDLLINPSNPLPGTKETVDLLVSAFAADLNVRVRSEGVPDVRNFFTVTNINIVGDQTGVDKFEPIEVWHDDNVHVTATVVTHGELQPSLAYRFDTADGSIVFSGDTSFNANLIALATNADILVHEAVDPSWVSELLGPEPWSEGKKVLSHQIHSAHVTPEQAGEVATAAGVKTLVLSHLVPGNAPESHWQKASETFNGEIIIGTDLTEIRLND